MPMPSKAITNGLRSGRVRSAANAMATPAMAPQPCKAAPHHNRGHSLSQRSDNATGGKQQQTQQHHRAPAPAIGKPAERLLQQRLGQAIDTHSQPGRLGCVTGTSRASTMNTGRIMNRPSMRKVMTPESVPA